MNNMQIIIHFDDGTSLEHYGVPGMKWGRRKLSDIKSGVKRGLSSLKSDASSVKSRVMRQVLTADRLKGFNAEKYLSNVGNRAKSVIMGSSIGTVKVSSKAIKQIARYERNQKVKAFFNKVGAKPMKAAKSLFSAGMDKAKRVGSAGIDKAKRAGRKLKVKAGGGYRELLVNRR